MLKLMAQRMIHFKLWLLDKINFMYTAVALCSHSYHTLIKHQDGYTRKLEYHNTIAQLYIARAYLRSAKGHFAIGEYLQTIDKCMMAACTYGYRGNLAYKLSFGACRILNNSQSCEGLHSMVEEIRECQKLNKLNVNGYIDKH